MKLTKAQISFLNSLSDGPSVRVTGNTIKALELKGLVEYVPAYQGAPSGHIKVQITDEGKKAL